MSGFYQVKRGWFKLLSTTTKVLILSPYNRFSRESRTNDFENPSTHKNLLNHGVSDKLTYKYIII